MYSTHIINTPVYLPVVSTTVSGQTIPSIRFIRDGQLDPTIYSVSEIDAGQNLYSVSFFPDAPGVWHVYLEGKVVAGFKIVNKDYEEYLKNIEDEAIGSWQWNKTTGQLQLFRQNGDPFQQFTIVDNNLETSREIIVVAP